VEVLFRKLCEWSDEVVEMSWHVLDREQEGV
jgi:hypothetical protein